MKYSVALVTLALASFGAAASVSDVPACAVPCIDDATASSTTCAPKDYSCMCKQIDAITAKATSCVLAKCTTPEALTTVTVTKEICANPPAPAVSSSAAPAPSSSAAPAPSSSVAPTSTVAPDTSSAPAPSSSVAPTTSAAPTTIASSVVPTKNATTVVPTPTPSKGTVFTGAASQVVAGLGYVAAAGLAVFAL